MNNPQDLIESAKRAIQIETQAVAQLADRIDASFVKACDLIMACKGRVVVTGMGKSGHIGSKIAATLASTGTPAYFVHPVEANHGDLGMITRDDAIIALSWSGESAELKGIVAYARRFSIPLVAITSGANSALAREASVALCLPRVPEACPHNLAPTTSTLLQLVIGDALALALLEARGFTADHFRTFHPGGQLGAKLTHVGDIMRRGEDIPIVPPGTKMPDAVMMLSKKRLGCVCVVNEDGRLVGIIT